MFTVGSTYFTTKFDTTNVRAAWDFIIIHNIGGTLLSLGENDNYYSSIAKSWKIEKNKIIFQIDENARFSDGTSITTHDVKKTFERLIQKGATHLDLKNILDSVTTNDKDIIFKFKSINSQILYLFTLPDASIISQKQLNNKNEIVSWEISSGAYHIDSINENYIVLEKNKYGNLPKNESLDKVRIEKIQNQKILAEKLAAKEINYIFDKYFADKEALSQIINSNNVTKNKYKPTNVTYLLLNTRNKLVQNIKNRQSFYKKFKNLNLDLRPIKNDDYYVNADQFFLPGSQASIDKNEANSIVSKFKEKKFLDHESYAVVINGPLEPSNLEYLFSKLSSIGLKLHLGPTYVAKNYTELAFKAPFNVGVMF